MDRKIRTLLLAIVGVCCMSGLAWASVPLYRLFCQATGYAGTPKRISEAEAATIKADGKTISIRFDANTDRGMPWMFRAQQTTQTVPIGERRMAIFEARNDSDHPITGRARYNIEPEQAAPYFTKVQCFCFNEHTLQPGETIEVPLVFYVDPKLREDADIAALREMTLSYTYYPSKNGAPTTAAADGRPGTPTNF